MEAIRNRVRREGRRSSGSRSALVLATVAALGLAACGQAEDGQDGAAADVSSLQPINIRYADFAGDNNNTAEGMRRFSEAVAEASDGKITFEYFYSGALLGADDMAEGVGGGIADMGIVNSTYSPQLLPVGNWASALGSVPSKSFPLGTLQGTAATAEFGLTNPELVNEAADANLVMLGPLYAIQQFDLLCTTPVTNLQEAEGIRVRTGGQTWSKEAEAIGMTPVPLTGAELFEGFQRGIVDCAMVHPPAYIGFDLWEIGEYYTPTRFSGWNAFNLAMNKDFWDGLPLVARQILWDATPLFLEGYHAKNFEFYKQFGDEAGAKGIEFGQVNAELGSAIEAFQQSEIDKMTSSAPPGVADPASFVADYQAAIERWKAPVVERGFEERGDSPSDWEEAFQTAYDLTPWTQMIKEEIYDKHRPS